MKYLAIAALAAVSAKEKTLLDGGCQEGIKMEFFSDDGCETALTMPKIPTKEELAEATKKGVKAIADLKKKTQPMALTPSRDDLKTFNKDCIAFNAAQQTAWKPAKSQKITCNGAGFKVDLFKEDDCDGASVPGALYVWGQCTEVPENIGKAMKLSGDVYVKMTGAAILQATAAAALALVATQY